MLQKTEFFILEYSFLQISHSELISEIVWGEEFREFIKLLFEIRGQIVVLEARRRPEAEIKRVYHKDEAQDILKRDLCMIEMTLTPGRVIYNF